ncbi:hypothetical protein K443DRAFT_533309 [Laccaria amethystina LaAM-08-1]|uniref:Uncharacterized protein n=1 Tax=Laccaria amethystina LaAM-08-1 TaxID=1095629 RepID=A0A0C9X940_9AGAR|nr:hypothetical protein K443DRAFT_533309 [Laccaria amethystina LaAM-08-1]
MISGEMKWLGGQWGSVFVLPQPFKFYLNSNYVLSQRSLSITPSRECCQLSNEDFIKHRLMKASGKRLKLG